jgi:hypothetical protein
VTLPDVAPFTLGKLFGGESDGDRENREGTQGMGKLPPSSIACFRIPPVSGNGCKRRAPCKGGAFQWVQIPPGDSLQPEAIGAVMEVTKWLKPSISGHDLVTVRACRPQRE